MEITEILDSRLCIGCGFCAVVCPQSCIQIIWDVSKTWLPKINHDKCDDCGLCLKVCPNSVESLKAAGQKAINKGEMCGLNDRNNNTFYISYRTDNDRTFSASGGTGTKLLQHLLERGDIDLVVGARPRMAKIGEPHFETVICRTPEELKACRSSAYGPLRYDVVLREIKRIRKPCAITVLPCVQRAIDNLPEKWGKYIKYTVGIVCSHNVTDQFADYMARCHQISGYEAFYINYRDKIGIPDANRYNTLFKLKNGGEIRTPRMGNGFTPAWRNYWFAQECCLYCPDFYNTDSDISIKDAWGKMSVDPLGISLCIVRNEKIKKSLHELKLKNDIYLEECNEEVIKTSQNDTAKYKQVDFLYRWRHKSVLKKAAKALSQRSIENKSAVKDHYKKLITIYVTKYLFRGSPFSRYLLLLFIKRVLGLLPKANNQLKKSRKTFDKLIASFIPYCSVQTNWGVPPKSHNNRSLQVLITGGYGYQNVGDEAQLGANISRWEKISPGCKIRVFSPNPNYTARYHRVESIRAPRIIWFKADKKTDYSDSNRRFIRRFFGVKLRMILSAYLLHSGLPPIACKPSEYSILNEIMKADVFHVSGGGFLTGMTRSRLWENCLLMRLCYILGTSFILTGQTIGVFQTDTDRKLTKWGLEHAKLIYLRDNGDSEADVNALGIKGDHVRSTFDDALFCERAQDVNLYDYFTRSGIDSSQQYVAVNFHSWNLSSIQVQSMAKRMSEICDYIKGKYKFHIVFVPMHPSDIHPEETVINMMCSPSSLLNYDYDYRIAKSVYRQAEFILTMKHHPIIFAYGEGTPSIAVAVDPYYKRKNSGAMSLCGQEEYCMDYNIFMSKDALDIIDNMYNNLDSNHSKITNWLSFASNQPHGINSFIAGNKYVNE